jgi:hypothetical protein
MKLDFGAISQKQQSTEPVSEVGHIILTPNQPVFVVTTITHSIFWLPKCQYKIIATRPKKK